MTIKPPGGTPLTDPFAGAPDNAAAGKPRSRTAESARFADHLQDTQLSGVISQFSRADLNDPKTADKMVRQIADELLQNEWGGPGGLSEADRKNLVSFLSDDPTFQAKAKSWFTRAAKR